jgi:hypothetical protein
MALDTLQATLGVFLGVALGLATGVPMYFHIRKLQREYKIKGALVFRMF